MAWEGMYEVSPYTVTLSAIQIGCDEMAGSHPPSGSVIQDLGILQALLLGGCMQEPSVPEVSAPSVLTLASSPTRPVTIASCRLRSVQ